MRNMVQPPCRWAWLIVTVLGLACAAARAQQGDVVYHETFSPYGNTAPAFTEACAIGEYPPSLKHLEYRPTKPGSVYRDRFTLPKEAQGLTDYEFEFAFRFQKEGPKSIDFRLDFLVDGSARQPKYASCSMRIAEDNCGVMAVSGHQPKLPAVRTPTRETALHPLIGGSFYRAIVRVQGNRLEAFVEGPAGTTRVGAAEVGGHPLAGFNFSGAAPFDLDDIVVRKIAPLPAGDSREEAGAKVANRAAEYSLPVPAGANTASACFRLGNPGTMRLGLVFADGSAQAITVSTFGTMVNLPAMKEKTTLKDGKAVVGTAQVHEPRALPDAGLKIREVREGNAKGGLDLTCNIRPWIDGYTDEGKQGIARRWEEFEAASRHFLKFEARRDARGIEYWIDGRYCGRRESASPLVEIRFTLPAEGAIKDAVAMKVERDGQYLPLEVAHTANPGAMASARLPMAAGPAMVKGVPFVVAPGSGNLDLSVVKENLGSFALECDGYLSRSAFSGMPESFIFSVPSAQYARAYILCAVADDPARDPILTARLTRFPSPSAGGRGPAIADTKVALPRPGANAPLPKGVTRVGKVEYGEGPRKTPLYLVEVPLDAGKIQDVIFQEKAYPLLGQPYLDFEVLGKTGRAMQQLNKQHKPDSKSKSAVHVFGITLWKPAVEMELLAKRFGNAWQAGETPSLEVALRAAGRAECVLAWEVRDVDGGVIDSGEQKALFSAAGEERKVTVTPRIRGVGHYKARFQLLGAERAALIEHNASFAVVAPDTRKAGYDSPYFSWWFHGAHTTCADINLVGPLLKMAGVRRSHPASEEAGTPWMLTTGQLGSFTGGAAPEQLEAKRAEYAKKMDEWVTRFPHANAANIFHESCNGGGQFPLELYGIPVPLPEDPQRLQAQKNQVAGAVLAAQLYRERHPHVRPTLVNTGDSLAGAGMLMRHGFPKELLTAIGEESLGQTVPPEMSTALNFWMLRELARKMGYGDVPVDACYEWKGRNIRDIGERRSAAWRQRDALIAHAWGCRMVPVTGVIEPGNSYHNTVWGDDWMFSRSPQNYPYMSFSTTAHLTQVLDCAKFLRVLPTGSNSIYAMEFKREKDFVHALWTARGTAELSLAFAEDAAVRQSDMFGRPQDVKTSDRALAVTASSEPLYLESRVPVERITVDKRTYPEDQPPASAVVRVAEPMRDARRWEVSAKPDARLDNPPRPGGSNHVAFRQLGQYRVRGVDDPDRGACIEVELVQDKPVVPFLPEYTLLKLKEPAAVEGEPTTLGVWVRGNSGWGEIMWELEDAQGERWLSCGTGGYGCDIHDWPKQASVNFDGWNFVQFPIVQGSPVRVPNPGEVANQWRSGGGGNGRIDYPVKLTGLAVSMTRQALHLTEMKPVKTIIRLQGLSRAIACRQTGGQERCSR